MLKNHFDFEAGLELSWFEFSEFPFDLVEAFHVYFVFGLNIRL